MILLNRHASVFLNAIVDQVLRSRINELVSVQLPDMYSVLGGGLLTTAAGDKTKTL